MPGSASDNGFTKEDAYHSMQVWAARSSMFIPAKLPCRSDIPCITL